MAAGTAIEALEAPWRRQARAWAGDPAATWAWLETSLRRLDPSATVLVLGAPGRPAACLGFLGTGPRLAVPLARVLDRFAWAPDVTAGERDRALEDAARLATVFLPYVPAPALPGPAVAHSASAAGVCPLVTGSGWETYLAGRSRTLRKSLRLAQSRLRRSGTGLEPALLAPGETAERLGELAHVEARGHRRRGMVLSGRRGPFLARVIAALDVTGGVRTHVLRNDSGIQAYLLGFAARERYLLYTTGFDRRYERLSLGTLLMRDALRDALSRGERVDMGNGSSAFKRRWATGALPLAHVLTLPRADLLLPPGRPPSR